MSQSYPWFKLPHREYLLSLSYKVLKPVERLAFLELVMFAHTQEKNALPDNDKFLSAWAGMSVKQWLKVKANVFVEWLLVDGYWQLPTWFVVEKPTKDINQDDTRDDNKQDDISAKRSAAAKARWAAKNANDMQNSDANDANESCKTDANAMQNNNLHNAKTMQNDANANFAYANEGGKGGDLDLDLNKDLDLDQELKTKTTREASVCDARFDEFWIQYPRKENKQGAIKAFKKLKPSEKLFEEILLALSKQKTWPAFQNGYAPHAATWLNAKRWEDQPPINQATSKPVTGVFNGGESELMRANRAAMAEAKKMLFGEEAA